MPLLCGILSQGVTGVWLVSVTASWLLMSYFPRGTLGPICCLDGGRKGGRNHTWFHLPGATGLIFKSSRPKSDLKEKGASAAGGSFSPMVTISGPLRSASASFTRKNRKRSHPYL